jgi:cell division protease FtsH
MAQDNREDNRPPRFGNRPGEDPQAPKKGPRFSIYWIYAIIFAVLIGFQLFNPLAPNMAKISSLKFRTMLVNGEVAKYTIIDNRKTVKVTLTPEAKKKYQDVLKSNVTG